MCVIQPRPVLIRTTKPHSVKERIDRKLNDAKEEANVLLPPLGGELESVWERMQPHCAWIGCNGWGYRVLFIHVRADPSPFPAAPHTFTRPNTHSNMHTRTKHACSQAGAAAGAGG